MAITLRDVAVRAGVSAITVSRALNNSGYVSLDTRERINAAVTELSYVPNAVASSLRSNKTQLLALLLTDITNPFWTTVSRAVEDGAMEAGYGVILCNTDEDQSKEARYLDLLLRRRIDGLVVAPTSKSTHIVLIDRLVSGVAADIVRGDSKGGAYQMIHHLLSTHGYRRIGMLTGEMTVSTAEDRVAGYIDALNEADVPVDHSLIFYGNYRESWGYEVTRELMSRRSRPDAIFAANNFIALGVLEALRSMNLRVPQDVAVVCFDDTPQLTAAAPFLTTQVQPASEMGRVAIQLLLERLANPDSPPQDIIMPTKLIVRSSCGCNFDEAPRAHLEKRVSSTQ
jgi:LacI family transcriptional regulator